MNTDHYFSPSTQSSNDILKLDLDETDENVSMQWQGQIGQMCALGRGETWFEDSPQRDIIDDAADSPGEASISLP